MMKQIRLIVFSLFVSGCVNNEPQPLLLIATDATFAPFHLVNDVGRTTGFDVELARAVVKDAGFEPRVLVLPYDDLFSGLIDGTHDIVAATTGITSEREKIYSFTQPYFKTCQVAVIRAGSGEPQRAAELQGRRIGAAGSGTSAAAAKKIDGVHTKIGDGEGVNSLLNGTIDAWIVDEFDAVGAARHSGDQLQVMPVGISREEYGFVLAKNRPALLDTLNASLRALGDNGSIAKLRVQFSLDRDAGWPVRCDN
jgi:ABC-type amino acid transport substrate-binding protein